MTNKLTDEQREEIQRHLDQPLMKFDTREGLYDDAAEGKRLVRILLSSEQAWKEEARKLQEENVALVLQLDKARNNLGEALQKASDSSLEWNEEVERSEKRFNQAIEVVKVFLIWEEMYPSLKTYNKSKPFMVDDDYEQYRKIVEKAKALVSSLKEVSP